MPTPITSNGKAVAATNCDGLEFFSTASPPQQKDSDNDLLHDDGVRVHR